MNTHASKTKTIQTLSAANLAAENKGNKGLNLVDNRPLAVAQRKLQQTANLPSANISVIQRVVLFPEHEYTPGVVEPEIRTSVNFDTNHLVAGPVTDAIANNKRVQRGTAYNTVVNQAALRRQVETNDRDLIDRADTGVITTYNGFGVAEAKLASAGGVLHAPSIDLMARHPGGDPDIVEIHHLHDAEQQIDMDDFPALGAK